MITTAIVLYCLVCWGAVICSLYSGRYNPKHGDEEMDTAFVILMPILAPIGLITMAVVGVFIGVGYFIRMLPFGKQIAKTMMTIYKCGERKRNPGNIVPIPDLPRNLFVPDLPRNLFNPNPGLLPIEHPDAEAINLDNDNIPGNIRF